MPFFFTFQIFCEFFCLAESKSNLELELHESLKNENSNLAPSQCV